MFKSNQTLLFRSNYISGNTKTKYFFKRKVWSGYNESEMKENKSSKQLLRILNGGYFIRAISLTNNEFRSFFIVNCMYRLIGFRIMISMFMGNLESKGSCYRGFSASFSFIQTLHSPEHQTNYNSLKVNMLTLNLNCSQMTHSCMSTVLEILVKEASSFPNLT